MTRWPAAHPLRPRARRARRCARGLATPRSPPTGARAEVVSAAPANSGPPPLRPRASASLHPMPASRLSPPAPDVGMSWIPIGSFLMGSEDVYPEERPVRRVEAGAFGSMSGRSRWRSSAASYVWLPSPSTWEWTASRLSPHPRRAPVTGRIRRRHPATRHQGRFATSGRRTSASVTGRRHARARRSTHQRGHIGFRCIVRT
jgi:hypothetical protein